MHIPLYVISLGPDTSCPDMDAVQGIVVPRHADYVKDANGLWDITSLRKTITGMFNCCVDDGSTFTVDAKDVKEYIDHAVKENSHKSYTDSHYIVNGNRYCNGPEFAAMLYDSKPENQNEIRFRLEAIYDIHI